MHSFQVLDIRFFIACIVVMALPVGSAASETTPHPKYVRRVNVAGLLEVKPLAERAMQIGNEWYPEVCRLLADGKSHSPGWFDISFLKELPHRNSGLTQMNHIYLNASYAKDWQEYPGAFESILVHEIAHVAQHYNRSIIGGWLVYHHNEPAWLVEGIADFVSFESGATNTWRCAECNSSFPHYRDGYSCAGAFLLYLEDTCHPGIVRELNHRLRHGGYSDDFFTKTTGKNLDTLWAGFRETIAFTPSAARMLDLEQSLGFVANKPPEDIQQRIQCFVDSHLDAPTRDLINQARLPGLDEKNILGRLAVLCYFTQPGGTAEAFITLLGEKKQLPGFSMGDKGTLSGMLSTEDLNATFPVTRRFTAEKLNGDKSIYHYSVFRASADTGWKLLRAYRSNADGRIVEEYCIP